MEDAQPQPEIIEESPTKIETAEENIAIEEEEEPSVNTLIDSSDYIVNEAQLYLENGLSRHDYETLPHLTIGDQITIQNDDQILGVQKKGSYYGLRKQIQPMRHLKLGYMGNIL